MLPSQGTTAAAQQHRFEGLQASSCAVLCFSSPRTVSGWALHCAAQGLLPALAPMVPHLAEDAWQALPWAAPTTSVFQAGWFEPPPQWQSLSEAQLKAFRSLLLLR